MKRKFFMLALAGFVAFSFVGTSCGDDDDDDNTTPVVKPDDQKKDEEKKDEEKKDDTPAENTKNHYIVVECPEQTSADWDSQFWIVLPEGVQEGDDMVISFKCKADVATVDADGNEVKFGLQWHDNPSEYTGNLSQTASHTFTTEWQTIEIAETVGAVPEGKVFKSITWNLNNFDPENKYYFDDISVKVGGVEKVKNGNMEGTDFTSFAYKTAGKEADSDDGNGKPQPGKGIVAVEE